MVSSVGLIIVDFQTKRALPGADFFPPTESWRRLGAGAETMPNQLNTGRLRTAVTLAVLVALGGAGRAVQTTPNGETAGSQDAAAVRL
jgi:hypothetical protein